MGFHAGKYLYRRHAEEEEEADETDQIKIENESPAFQIKQEIKEEIEEEEEGEQASQVKREIEDEDDENDENSDMIKDKFQCKKIRAGEQSVKEEKEQEQWYDNNTYQCSLCGFKSRSLAPFERHVNGVHGAALSDFAASYTRTELYYECQFCLEEVKPVNFFGLFLS
jgi:hypothetical protein